VKIANVMIRRIALLWVGVFALLSVIVVVVLSWSYVADRITIHELSNPENSIYTRTRAATTLSQRRTKAARAALAAVLQDQSGAVRLAAISGLVVSGDIATLLAGALAASENPNPSVRADAVVTIGLYGPVERRDLNERIVKGLRDSAEEVHVVAIDVLRDYRPPIEEALADLVNYATRGKGIVREGAVRCLGRKYMHWKEAQVAVIGALGAPERYVRRAAIRSILTHAWYGVSFYRVPRGGFYGLR